MVNIPLIAYHRLHYSFMLFVCVFVCVSIFVLLWEGVYMDLIGCHNYAVSCSTVLLSAGSEHVINKTINYYDDCKYVIWMNVLY